MKRGGNRGKSFACSSTDCLDEWPIQEAKIGFPLPHFREKKNIRDGGAISPCVTTRVNLLSYLGLGGKHDFVEMR